MAFPPPLQVTLDATAFRELPQQQTGVLLSLPPPPPQGLLLPDAPIAAKLCVTTSIRVRVSAGLEVALYACVRVIVVVGLFLGVL